MVIKTEFQKVVTEAYEKYITSASMAVLNTALLAGVTEKEALEIAFSDTMTDLISQQIQDLIGAVTDQIKLNLSKGD